MVTRIVTGVLDDVVDSCAVGAVVTVLVIDSLVSTDVTYCMLTGCTSGVHAS